MPLNQRAVENGIEFVNHEGVAVAGIRDDGTIWGKGPQESGVAGAQGPMGPVGPKGEPGVSGASFEPQAVQITPPKDLASSIAATRAVINVLKDAGITV